MRKSSSANAAKIARADVVADKLKQVAGLTPEAQNYERGMIEYAQIIKSTIEKGTLAEKIDVERALLERDLLSAAGNPKLLKEAEEAIANFTAGMVVYDRLTTEPAEYRKYAAGFMPKHKMPGGIPKDELHEVLKNQNSREAQRDASRHNTEGEEALVKARKALLASIAHDYKYVQGVVLAGGDPPQGTIRGG
jgi:hypothetical protein